MGRAAKGSIPIIGPRSLAQLESNLAATRVTLSDAQIARLDEVSELPRVFPYTLLDDPGNRDRIAGGKLDRFVQPSDFVA